MMRQTESAAEETQTGKLVLYLRARHPESISRQCKVTCLPRLSSYFQSDGLNEQKQLLHRSCRKPVAQKADGTTAAHLKSYEWCEEEGFLARPVSLTLPKATVGGPASKIGCVVKICATPVKWQDRAARLLLLGFVT